MTHLTDVEIARTAQKAGFAGSGHVLSVAVCLAESAGDPRAVNVTGNTPPSRDRGLWQINDYWHPEVTDAEAFDPDQCARETYRISRQGSDWHQWSTFNSGSHVKFMERARAAVAALVHTMYTLKRYLSEGDDGTDVREVQRKVGAKVDGDFGPRTTEAVKLWQRTHKLDEDGIVGPHTAKSFGWRFTG